MVGSCLPGDYRDVEYSGTDPCMLIVILSVTMQNHGVTLCHAGRKLGQGLVLGLCGKDHRAARHCKYQAGFLSMGQDLSMPHVCDRMASA